MLDLNHRANIIPAPVRGLLTLAAVEQTSYTCPCVSVLSTLAGLLTQTQGDV